MFTINAHHTRQKNMHLLQQFINTKLGLTIPNCHGPKSSTMKDLNSLPDSLKSIQNNNKFKYEVEKFLQLQNQKTDENDYVYFYTRIFIL